GRGPGPHQHAAGRLLLLRGGDAQPDRPAERAALPAGRPGPRAGGPRGHPAPPARLPRRAGRDGAEAQGARDLTAGGGGGGGGVVGERETASGEAPQSRLPFRVRSPSRSLTAPRTAEIGNVVPKSGKRAPPGLAAPHPPSWARGLRPTPWSFR